MKRVQRVFWVFFTALLWAGAAQALTTYKVDFKLAGVMQVLSSEQTGPTTYEDTITKVKITNKDILLLLAIQYATVYPDGALLAFNSMNFVVLASDGTTILQAVGTPVMDLGTGYMVSNGVSDVSPTGGIKKTTQYSVYCIMNFNASYLLDLNGIGARKLNTSSATGSSKSSLLMKLAGGGTWGSHAAVLSGTFRGVSMP